MLVASGWSTQCAGSSPRQWQPTQHRSKGSTRRARLFYPRRRNRNDDRNPHGTDADQPNHGIRDIRRRSASSSATASSNRILRLNCRRLPARSRSRSASLTIQAWPGYIAPQGGRQARATRTQAAAQRRILRALQRRGQLQRNADRHQRSNHDRQRNLQPHRPPGSLRQLIHAGFHPAGRYRRPFSFRTHKMAKKLILAASPTFKSKWQSPFQADRPCLWNSPSKPAEGRPVHVGAKFGRHGRCGSGQDVASGWDLDDEFNDANITALTQTYCGSARAILDRYFAEQTGAKLGN